ncbi:MAG: hypothetical protein EPN98_11575 [Phenylobacterium sp.]|uniref:hypothetical protein n=1 Tax=Phenylobacterium sp. TaxID=1871053 RepID=UPI00122092C0|nr:hypothetical protein [Phenylobacterium sp.]TAL33328.1 MAG: hypothetical protein EPN98_11575 [Phenylobacterium sp.]
MRTLLIVAMLMPPLVLLGGCADALDAQAQSAHALKVRDAMNDYEKASASAPLDRCVKAKLVALAYEDARDPASASAWRARETADCQAAAMAAGVTSPQAGE